MLSLLRIRNTMDCLVLVFMLLYFSTFLFDCTGEHQSRYLRWYVCLWVCQSPMSKLAQSLAEVYHSSRAKLSRGAPELLILRLLAAPKLPNLSLFREVRRKSGLWRELTHGQHAHFLRLRERLSPQCKYLLVSLSLSHISGYPPKENRKYHFFWLCYLSSGTCGLLKKTKNKKIHLKFFHLFHFLGKKKVIFSIF